MPFGEAWEDGQTAHDDWLNSVENMLNRLEMAVNALGLKTSDIYQYRFSANTTGPPADGQVRYDAVPPLTTKIWVSEKTDEAVDISGFLNDWAADDFVYIQLKTNADNKDIFVITNPVVFAGYIECDVTVDSSVGTPFVGNNIISLIRIRQVTV